MPNALIDLNGQVRLSRTQKGYTWELVVPVVGLGPGAFRDALAIALELDTELAQAYGPLAVDLESGVKARGAK